MRSEEKTQDTNITRTTVVLVAVVKRYVSLAPSVSIKLNKRSVITYHAHQQVEPP